MRVSLQPSDLSKGKKQTMAPTHREMDKIVDEHFNYEARDDIEGVLSTLAEDVTHDIVGWPAGPSYGRENARKFYETLFADLADGKVECIKRLYGDNFVIDESLWKGSAPGRPFGIEGHGRPLEFRLLHVLEFADSGLIAKEAVWVDLAAIIQQLPQA
jgi:predicted ester cyclase